jgi:hypothetical protein
MRSRQLAGSTTTIARDHFSTIVEQDRRARYPAAIAIHRDHGEAYDGCKGRPEKAFGPTSGVHVCEESDDLIVPAKRANKAGPWASAELVEGRRAREGTVPIVDHVPNAVPESTGGVCDGTTVSPFSVASASDSSGEPYEVIHLVRI